ncbi:MAG: hypothetical protein V4688_04295 [Pseudomonadota bacterium]
MSHHRLLSFLCMTGLWLSAPAFAAGNCALAPQRPGVLLDYSGECRNGRVHGVADVIIELPPAADGRKRQAREFGWFQRGVPQGVHVAVLSDPEGKSPGFATLINFDAAGQTNWSFGQTAAYWPSSGTLLSSGPWSDVDGRAREAGVNYFTAKRPDGTAFSEGTTMIADVINQAVEFSMVAGVQSVNPATLRHFLTSVSITQPMAGVSSGFPADTIFQDSDEGRRGTEATLQAGEILARTREGCELITQVPDEKYRQTIIDSTLRKSWLGECVDGMALGPGTLLVRTNEDRISLIQHQWYFNGRPIGESTVTSFSSGTYQGGTIDSFSWEGSSFSRNRSAIGTPVAQTLWNNPPMAMEYSSQRKVIYTLLRSEGGWPAECGPDGNACLQEKILGSIPSTQNYYRCKRNDCTMLWAEKVMPVLAAHEAFKASHAADIEAAQKSVESTLAPLLTAQKTARRDAEVARIISDAQSAHEIERAKAAAVAKQARIAAEQAQAAENDAKAESRKKFWNNVLSGTTALIGAAATYAEARSGGASKGDATRAVADAVASDGSSGTAASGRLLTPRFVSSPQCPQRTFPDISREEYERYPSQMAELAPERCTVPRDTFTEQASVYWRLMKQYYPFKADGRGRKADGDYGSPDWAVWMAERILGAKEPPLSSGSLKIQATPAHLKYWLQQITREGDGALCELERQMDIQKGAGGHAEDYAIIRAEYNMRMAKADLKACMLLTLSGETSTR